MLILILLGAIFLNFFVFSIKKKGQENFLASQVFFLANFVFFEKIALKKKKAKKKKDRQDREKPTINQFLLVKSQNYEGEKNQKPKSHEKPQ